MADLTEKIQEAIASYMAVENGGGMVTRFYLIADVVDAEGQHAWINAHPAEQPLTDTLGLLEWARGLAAYEQHRYLQDSE